MKYRTVIFDFDGTLADSAALSLDIMNSLAPEFGFAPASDDELPQLKKMSARELLAKRIHIPLWNIPKLRRLERRVREKFAKRAGEIRVFDAIPEMMRSLFAAGLEIGVVSSNSQEIVGSVLGRADIETHFIHAGSRFFGKTRAIKSALEEYSVDRSHAIYVGDELRDLDACRKVGIDMIAVGWGFNAADALRSAGARVAATPQELLSILTSES